MEGLDHNYSSELEVEVQGTKPLNSQPKQIKPQKKTESAQNNSFFLKINSDTKPIKQIFPNENAKEQINRFESILFHNVSNGIINLFRKTQNFFKKLFYGLHMFVLYFLIALLFQVEKLFTKFKNVFSLQKVAHSH